MSDKEARVYLAMMELGPSAVQDIAKQAQVNRATTYILIDNLKRRGLVSSIEQGDRQLLVAESPDHLMRSTHDELQQVEQKKKNLEELMPQFMALFNAVDDKPKVRYFEGEEGIFACRNIAWELAKGTPCWRTFTHIDQVTADIGERHRADKQRFSRGSFRYKMLYSLEPDVEMPFTGENVEMRQAPLNMSFFHGEFVIFEKFVVIFTYKTKPMGVLVESSDIAKFFQAIFDLSWNAAQI